MMSSISVINKFKKLIYKIAYKYARKNPQEDIEDLIQIGILGLLNFYQIFDPKKSSTGEIPFTYARISIEGKILKYFRDNALIRYPRSLKNRKTILPIKPNQINNLFYVNDEIKKDYLDLYLSIENLPNREKDVIYYYFQGKNLKEIDKIIGKTDATVCRIKKNAENKLKNRLIPKIINEQNK